MRWESQPSNVTEGEEGRGVGDGVDAAAIESSKVSGALVAVEGGGARACEANCKVGGGGDAVACGPVGGVEDVAVEVSARERLEGWLEDRGIRGCKESLARDGGRRCWWNGREVCRSVSFEGAAGVVG